MKIFNIYIGIICSLLLFITTSCDQDNIGTKYTPENEAVTFFSAKGNIVALPSETSVDVLIARGNTNGRLEIPITATYNESVFTLPATVVFEDGAGTAKLSIPLDKTVLGVTYSIALALDSAIISPFGVAKTTVSVMRDYDWEIIGTASLESTWYLETYDVDVKKRQDGDTEVYQIIEPYGAGYNLLLAVDDSGNVTVSKQTVDVDSGVAPITVEGGGTLKDGVIDLTLDFIMWYPAGVVYYSELGNSEIITLP